MVHGFNQQPTNNEPLAETDLLTSICANQVVHVVKLRVGHHTIDTTPCKSAWHPASLRFWRLKWQPLQPEPVER